jgi:hypothetical protein
VLLSVIFNTKNSQANYFFEIGRKLAATGHKAQNKYVSKHECNMPLFKMRVIHNSNSALPAAENLKIAWNPAAARPITAARFRYDWFCAAQTCGERFAVGRAAPAEMIQSIPSGSPSRGRKCVRVRCAQTLSREATSRRWQQQWLLCNIIAHTFDKNLTHFIFLTERSGNLKSLFWHFPT